MAGRLIQLLCMSCNVCMILHVCSIQGVACDVPDDVVYTDLRRHVQIGDNVALKCQFRGTPFAVHWMKGNDPQRALNLVSWTRGVPVTGLCEVKKLCQIMEMNEDHSLVIKEVRIAEEGCYICRVKSYKREVIHNLTEVSVFSPPKKPYPFINECLMSPEINFNQTCTLPTTEDPINISCTASGYFPDLDLFFLCGSQSITPIHSEETTNEDGKKNKSITIQASPRPESYMCVASDIPGVAGQRVASVLLTPTTALVDQAGTTLPVKIVVPVIVTILFVVILRAFIRWRNQQKETTAGNCDDDDDMTSMDPGSGEVHLNVATSEEAGRMVDNNHSPVRRLMALELPENVIAARNEDEPSVTNSRMWDQRLSNYEIKRRLRQTEESYNRHDVADVFIPRDQGPDLLTPKNPKQFLQKSVSVGGSPNHYGPCGSQTCTKRSKTRSELIQIMVMHINGRTLIETCRSTDSVKNLIVKISGKLNIAPSQLSLSSQGKSLTNKSTCSLKCHGLNNLSTVHVHVRLMGGSLF